MSIDRQRFPYLLMTGLAYLVLSADSPDEDICYAAVVSSPLKAMILNQSVQSASQKKHIKGACTIHYVSFLIVIVEFF